MAGPEFRRDLYRGAASDYERFRVPYPPDLTRELARRAGADGTGRLLDLACGTGQLAFALCGSFRETWAVDQEPDMVSVATAKAAAGPAGSVRVLAAAAEDLAAPAAAFDLVTIGNAFHRLRRERVAQLVRGWLVPGGCLALVWTSSPWAGDAPWQRAMSATMDRWRDRIPGGDRVPAGYEQDRRDRPDRVILGDCGLETGESWALPVSHEWSVEALTGFVFSTAVLSRAALGGQAGAFAAELERDLLGCVPGGRFRQVISFACELARRPG